MKKAAPLLILVLILVLGGQFPEMAAGQAPAGTGPSLQPSRRPTVSPYLSLLGGNSAAAQYYRQVQPDFQFYATGRELRDYTRSLQTQITDVRQELNSPRPLSDLSPTGVGAGFMTHTRFFNRTAAGQGGSPVAESRGGYRPPPRRGR